MRVYLGSLEGGNEPPSYAHCVEIAMSVFDDNTTKCFSLNIRLEALNRILSSGQLEGWINSSDSEDYSYIPESIFIAAGTTPLVADGSKASFNKDELLKMAFNVSKTSS